eukprot:scaffold8853_cov103-Isochrysis_galbana.AAC.2
MGAQGRAGWVGAGGGAGARACGYGGECGRVWPAAGLVHGAGKSRAGSMAWGAGCCWRLRVRCLHEIW